MKIFIEWSDREITGIARIPVTPTSLKGMSRMRVLMRVRNSDLLDNADRVLVNAGLLPITKWRQNGWLFQCVVKEIKSGNMHEKAPRERESLSR